MMKPKGYFVEFTVGGRTQFSGIVDSDSEEMFLSVWGASGKRLFSLLTRSDDTYTFTGYGEFRIRPIID